MIKVHVASVRPLANKTCDFDAIANRMIHDRIVIGVRDEGLRETLLKRPDLTLKICIEVGRAFELKHLKKHM